MKLFRHYKNKLYKFKSIVKHSESLEDLVLYDCLYENPTGRTWVRPKDLFFGSLEIDGKKVQRFSEVGIDYEEIFEPDSKLFIELLPIIENTLDSLTLEDLEKRLKGKKNTLLLLARVEGEVVGFKLGYELDGESYYSWLGAVLPGFQGLGIASELMTRQHKWCVERSYKRVRTKTLNHRKAMLVLNIKSGFDILHTYTSQNGELKIVLEKKL